MSGITDIRLRPVVEGDLIMFFAHQADPVATAMAGSAQRERAAFDTHWRTILAGPKFVVASIEVGGAVAGYVSTFPRAGGTELAYFIGRAFWGRGIGRSAVAAFLAMHRDRPLHAGVIETNQGSIAILERCGFVRIGEESGTDGVVERRYRLGR